MNEATFEARLDATIRTLFPGLAPPRVTHQTTLTVHLGHGDYVVDGKPRDHVSGRLDVLVEVDSKPVMLLELKAPGVGLTNDDRIQAMSYARLLQQMPPLFAVSNGTETRIYTTHNGDTFVASTLDEAAVERVFSEALLAAAEDRDAAVREILGRKPELWAQIARRETHDALTAITGLPSEFTHPLCSIFSIERNAARQVRELVEADEKVVAVVGPAMSGKTNVLAQFCRLAQRDRPVLFVDASGLSHGIWQHVANLITQHLLQRASADDARQWLTASLHDVRASKFVVVIDGLRPDVNETLRASFDELVRMVDRSSLRLVLALDEDQLARVSTVAGRPTRTLFGRLVKQVPVSPLTDEEFDAALALLRDEHRLGFPDGVEYNPELREPRVLRLNLALAKRARPQPPDHDDIVSGPSFATAWVLESVWTTFAPDPDVRLLLKRLARAFVEGAWTQASRAHFAFEQHRRAAIPLECARAYLDESGLSRLRAEGFVTTSAREDELLLMRVPELLAAAGAYVIASTIDADSEPHVAYARLVRESQRLPYGEVAGALALFELTKSNMSRFNELVRRLLADPPVESSLGRHVNIDVISGEGLIPVTIDTEADGGVGAAASEEGVFSVTEEGDGKTLSVGRPIRNLQPWLIASHVAHFEVGSPSDDGAWHVAIFATLGNSRYELRRVDTLPVEQMRPVLVHRLPTGDDILCHHTGIVEPLAHAMLQHMVRVPDAMVDLAENAIRADHFFLVWRMMLVAMNATAVAIPAVAERAIAVQVACQDYWKATFAGLGLH